MIRNENTYQIIKSVAKSVNVKLDETHMSTSNLLLLRNQNQGKTNANRQPLSIIVSLPIELKK